MLLPNLMSFIENGASVANELVSAGMCQSETGENNCTTELQVEGTVQYSKTIYNNITYDLYSVR